VKYSDGNEAKLGDVVAIDDTYRGIVVANFDGAEYSPEHPSEDWSYLAKGILINTDFAGLVHYPDCTNEPMVLISRVHKP
jgi:hypothetical protein